MDNKMLIDLISIPLFTGVIGYVTNWTGVLMLFRPLRFYGLRVPGLRPARRMVPFSMTMKPNMTNRITPAR